MYNGTLSDISDGTIRHKMQGPHDNFIKTYEYLLI